LVFNFALDYDIKKVQANQKGLELNGIDQQLVYVDYINILGGNKNTTKTTEPLLGPKREVDLEVNTEVTK
jgi:hypothetical protein